MSRERDKLIMILKELDRDYQAGRISQEKYVSLRRRYVYKINNMDGSDKSGYVRGDGKSSDGSGFNSDVRKFDKGPNNSRVGGYYDENGKFHAFNSDGPRNIGSKKNLSEDKKSNKVNPWLVALLCIILLCAFGTGIVMGVFNNSLGGDIGDIMGSGASINDTAFPIAEKNVTATNVSSYVSDYSYDYDDSGSDSSSYSSSGSSSYSSSGSGDSGGSSSGSGGSSSGSGGSGSGGSGSGGSGSGGSGSGGSGSGGSGGSGSGGSGSGGSGGSVSTI